MTWFKKPKRKLTGTDRRELPTDVFEKCPQCGEILYRARLEQNLFVCPECGHHNRIGAEEYLQLLLDDGEYTVRTVEGALEGIPVCLAVMDFEFIGGSMGSVVGEKISRIGQRALQERKPLVIVSASGGARMMEGILSLMQMAKTSVMLAQMHEAGVPFVSVLTDPTTGGVTASYAMLGDVHIAEPGALIGFAGPRVIEQTIKQELPEGFQRSEFLLEHGMVDSIVDRRELKIILARLLRHMLGLPAQMDKLRAIADKRKQSAEAILGRIDITTMHEGGMVRLQVADDGIGMSEAVQARVFEPFFTTKEVGRGMGQGLAMARSMIIKKLHGSIAFESRAGVGTTFTITLPCTLPPA